MNQFKYVLLIMLPLLFSCSEEANPDLDNFVVEGFIIANEKIDNIKIKTISPFDSEEVNPEVIEDAIINITQADKTFPLTFNPSTGLYENFAEELDISYNEEYRLEVRVDDRIATSSTIVPNLPTGLRLSKNQLVIPQLELNFTLREQISTLFDEERILLEWDAVPGQNFFVVIEQKAESIDPILPSEIPAEATELLSSFRFISAPTEETSFEIIGIALETYGPHIAKVYTVNQEYVDLYNNAEQDSRDLNEPPTNISNALGIFTAFAVDSVAFEVVRP